MVAQLLGRREKEVPHLLSQTFCVLVGRLQSTSMNVKPRTIVIKTLWLNRPKLLCTVSTNLLFTINANNLWFIITKWLQWSNVVLRYFSVNFLASLFFFSFYKLKASSKRTVIPFRTFYSKTDFRFQESEKSRFRLKSQNFSAEACPQTPPPPDVRTCSPRKIGKGSHFFF